MVTGDAGGLSWARGIMHIQALGRPSSFTASPVAFGRQNLEGAAAVSPTRDRESLELENLSTQLKISRCILFRNSLPSCGERKTRRLKILE